MIALQVFGLIVHLFLVIGLVAIGYFDFLGMTSTAESSAQLLKNMAPTGDGVINQISSETINAAASLLSVIKTFAISAMVSFVAHAVAYWRCIRNTQEINRVVSLDSGKPRG
ncbi:hypothetical protein [Sulfuriferula multivorans]|uniref:hypothetical protein n=1 Tax=Sulfuriferula multivorans TaxID=1559896 RepID=UPI000F5B8D38|nr:hypothetical protein [Sulfuriferula multivorans]